MGGLPPQARLIGTLVAYAALCCRWLSRQGTGASATRVDSGTLQGLASGPLQLVQGEKQAVRFADCLVLLLLQTLALGEASLALENLAAKTGASSLSINISHCSLLSCTRDEAYFLWTWANQVAGVRGRRSLISIHSLPCTRSLLTFLPFSAPLLLTSPQLSSVGDCRGDLLLRIMVPVLLPCCW